MGEIIKFDNLEAMLEAHRRVPTPEEVEIEARVAPVLDKIFAEITEEEKREAENPLYPLFRGVQPYTADTPPEGEMAFLLEPVTLKRDDGLVVNLERTRDGEVILAIDRVFSWYSYEDVSKLGDGCWDVGVYRLASRGVFGEPTDFGKIRPFGDELRAAA